MKKNKFNNNAGLTLIEILIGVVISAIMMTAMYTTYSVVNNSYSQVTDRAKISRSGRDIVAMLMRDIRLAGFKYYFGKNTEGISIADELIFKGGTTTVEQSHDPLIIVKDTLGWDGSESISTTPLDKHDSEKDLCCDRIHIVYGDFDQNDDKQKYKRYKITYYAEPRSNGQDKYYGVYKTKESWEQTAENPSGSWIISCPECYEGELIRDHLVDMEFIAFNQHGRIINPPPRPGPESSSRKDLYNIRSVDVRLTFRSKKEFYRFNKLDAGGNIIPRLVKGLGDRTTAIKDKYLRDSVVVTIHTRNIGQ